MNETFCVGIHLAHKNLPQARWNRLAARLRRMGTRQVGGLFEFDEADPARLETWLQDELEPGDWYVIRVVLPDAFLPGKGQVAWPRGAGNTDASARDSHSHVRA